MEHCSPPLHVPYSLQLEFYSYSIRLRKAFWVGQDACKKRHKSPPPRILFKTQCKQVLQPRSPRKKYSHAFEMAVTRQDIMWICKKIGYFNSKKASPRFFFLNCVGKVRGLPLSTSVRWERKWHKFLQWLCSSSTRLRKCCKCFASKEKKKQQADMLDQKKYLELNYLP